MTETMIERVARAIARRRVEMLIDAGGFAVPTNPDWWATNTAVDEDDRAEARAAIEAMREPTVAMKLASFDASGDAEAEAWPAMIQAALEEPR